MLRPSYTELMDVINDSNNVDNKITSRYTIVNAVSKRARQLIDGSAPLTYAPTDKAVSIAVNEIFQDRIQVKLNEGSGEFDSAEIERSKGVMLYDGDSWPDAEEQESPEYTEVTEG